MNIDPSDDVRDWIIKAGSLSKYCQHTDLEREKREKKWPTIFSFQLDIRFRQFDECWKYSKRKILILLQILMQCRIYVIRVCHF